MFTSIAKIASAEAADVPWRQQTYLGGKLLKCDSRRWRKPGFLTASGWPLSRKRWYTSLVKSELRRAELTAKLRGGEELSPTSPAKFMSGAAISSVNQRVEDQSMSRQATKRTSRTSGSGSGGEGRRGSFWSAGRSREKEVEDRWLFIESTGRSRRMPVRCFNDLDSPSSL